MKPLNQNEADIVNMLLGVSNYLSEQRVIHGKIGCFTPQEELEIIAEQAKGLEHFAVVAYEISNQRYWELVKHLLKNFIERKISNE